MSHPSSTWPLLSDQESEFGSGVSQVEPGVDWALDANGDLIVPMRYTTGLEAVAQGIRIRIQMFKGEWFLNLDEGVPYLAHDGIDERDTILGQKFNETKARAAFRTAILSAPGVDELVALAVSLDRATRVLYVTWRVKTSFGIVDDGTEI